MPAILKPDAKALVWLILGAVVAPKALKMFKR